MNPDDKVIAQIIETRFKQNPRLDHAKVTVNNGVVSLTGEVESIDASVNASEVARSVAGVRAVKNDLAFSRSSLK